MKIQQNSRYPRQYWFKKPISAKSLQGWLIDKGSLTSRLKARYQDFAVQPLRVEYAKAFKDEYRLIGLKANQRALVRDVLLIGNKQAVVYAHSVLPRTSLRGAWRGLGKLGNQPLGAALFANPKVQRTPLQFKKLSPLHPIAKRAAAHCALKPCALWARRSVFHLGCAKILVTEVFLPHILAP